MAGALCLAVIAVPVILRMTFPNAGPLSSVADTGLFVHL